MSWGSPERENRSGGSADSGSEDSIVHEAVAQQVSSRKG